MRLARPHLDFNRAEPPATHFRMIGRVALRAAAKPAKASPNTTSIRAERATLAGSLGTSAGRPQLPDAAQRDQTSTSTADISPRDTTTRATLLPGSYTTAPRLQPCKPHATHFRMIGLAPLRAAAMPLKASPNTTPFRAERLTLEASARPRHARTYPARDCVAQPAPQQLGRTRQQLRHAP